MISKNFVFFLLCFLLAATVSSAQVDPAMLNKAKSMGISQSQIDAAMAAQQQGQQGNTGQGQNPYQQTNAYTLRDTAQRIKITPEDLKRYNPDGTQMGYQQLYDLQHPEERTDLREYEYVLRDSVLVRKQLPLVFGHEIFSNKNLTFAPNYNMATPESYRLGGGDEVIVEVWGAAEMYTKQKISPEGSINIQGVGPIPLNGLTIAEAKNRIQTRLSQIVEDMGATSHVSVTLGQIRSITVNIVGEVKVPGTYLLPSISTLFNALYSAGGVNKIGSLRNIKVFRNSRLVANLDVYDYLINGKFDTNIRLEDNDMIIVSPYDNFVTAYGNVKRERIYEMKKGEPLEVLLKYAGGFKGDAYTESIAIKRKTGRQYQVVTVDAEDYPTFVLTDGDSVSVGRVIDEYANKLVIEGAVWRPGIYELSPKIETLSQLIAKAEGLKGNEFASRGQITRRKADYSYELLPFDVRAVVTGREDIPLMRDDSVYIPTIFEMREDYTVQISGEVNRPDTIEFREGMTIEDLIVKSGGLKESASLARIEVARRIKNPKSTEYTNRTADVYTFEIDEALSVTPEAKRFVLHPFDEVFVRRSPGYRSQEVVELSGEVLFEGSYALATAGERISDLIKKAGGVTPEAYVKGASLQRKMTDDEKAKVVSLMKIAKNSAKGRDSLSVESLEINTSYPIGVDVAHALANPGSSDDVVLQKGDRLVIPKYTGTVKISGSVLYPNSVTFTSNKLKDYISQAGGYKSESRKRPFVIYMNGKVAATRSGLFGRRYPKIEPGCEVVVPMKPENPNKLGLAGVMSLASSTTSMAAMIATMVNTFQK